MLSSSGSTIQYSGIPASGSSGADDLDYQVGAEPVTVLPPWVVGVAHQQNVRLTMLAGADLEA
jgi:hypothetical protein